MVGQSVYQQEIVTSHDECVPAQQRSAVEGHSSQHVALQPSQNSYLVECVPACIHLEALNARLLRVWVCLNFFSGAVSGLFWHGH